MKLRRVINELKEAWTRDVVEPTKEDWKRLKRGEYVAFGGEIVAYPSGLTSGYTNPVGYYDGISAEKPGSTSKCIVLGVGDRQLLKQLNPRGHYDDPVYVEELRKLNRVAWRKFCSNRATNMWLNPVMRRRITNSITNNWVWRRLAYSMLSLFGEACIGPELLKEREVNVESGRKSWITRRANGNDHKTWKLKLEVAKTRGEKIWAIRRDRFGPSAGSNFDHKLSAKKAWVTRRERYGLNGIKDIESQRKTRSEAARNSSGKGWATRRTNTKSN